MVNLTGETQNAHLLLPDHSGLLLGTSLATAREILTEEGLRGSRAIWGTFLLIVGLGPKRAQVLMERLGCVSPAARARLGLRHELSMVLKRCRRRRRLGMDERALSVVLKRFLGAGSGGRGA
ncbi:hypothetical protein P7K49_029641 [Saguinus oedipus]|uniref:Uncharacterized protein n=1 Tax=Saguinus oedipus TaxID=9490 RepID=A0ABQ9U9U4_SAGOE|nr:hypothetical protein P7K49_029641 [Saguinus oedipus]